MKMDLRQEIESLIADQQKTIDKTMRNVYKDGYMHTAYEIQKGMHIGWDFSTIDKRKIDKVINNPWAADGKNFSERIWGNGTKLVGELNQILTQNIILGESPQKAIDKLSKRMDVSKRAAGRLVMTEQAFFSTASQREAFKELDVEEFEIVATLDSHTSNICRSMDGRHFPMSKWEVGVNAPPFHVYCRSTTVPYFDDEEELGIVGERAARNENGEVYYVPGNMTYKEWERAFVKGGAKDDMEQLSISDFLEKGRNDGIIKMDLQMFARMPKEKFVNYALNYSKAPDKAKAFEMALGYTIENADELMENISKHIDESKFVEKGDLGYGMRYEYIMELEGINGKKANVLTAWIQDKDEKRLTSVYVTNKEISK